jgi:hypothetical protein
MKLRRMLFEGWKTMDAVSMADARKKARKHGILHFEYQEWLHVQGIWRTLSEVDIPEFRCAFCKTDIYQDQKCATHYGHVYCDACYQRVIAKVAASVAGEERQ